MDKSKRIDRIIEAIGDGGETALDIGIGSMVHDVHDIIYGRLNFKKITVVERHKAWLDERAEAWKDRENYKFINEDINKYKTDESFDVITMLHVIEHLAKDEAAETLSKLKSICNNTIIIETPNEREPNTENIAARTGNPHQQHRFVADRNFMESNGFSRLFTYRQNELYTNSAYTWQPKK